MATNNAIICGKYTFAIQGFINDKNNPLASLGVVNYDGTSGGQGGGGKVYGFGIVKFVTNSGLLDTPYTDDALPGVVGDQEPRRLDEFEILPSSLYWIDKGPKNKPPETGRALWHVKFSTGDIAHLYFFYVLRYPNNPGSASTIDMLLTDNMHWKSTLLTLPGGLTQTHVLILLDRRPTVQSGTQHWLSNDPDQLPKE